MRRLAVAIMFACIVLSVALPTAAQKSLTELSDSFEALSKRVTPSVVQIFTTGYGPSQDATGSSLIAKQRGTGSGVIVDADGYIVTNAHVVQNARRVQVMIPYTEKERAERSSILKVPGRVVGGQIIGIDTETDVAVVKVQERDLPALPIANSDGVAPGQIVLAFGSPFGLSNSVSMGVVSSAARQLAPEHPMVYIQTDATINPGNSGGPLVNTNGEMVGINAMIFTQSGGSEGIGFAVPSNIVRAIYNQIRNTGRVRRGMIGVHAQTIDPTLAAGLGLPQAWGVVLGDVYPGSPAESAGLRIGDVVTAIDGKPMENGRQLDVNVYRKDVGSNITVEYMRGDKKGTARVQVAERTDNPDRFADLASPEDNLVDRLGILGLNLTPPIAQLLPNLRHSEGVVVAAQSTAGPAWQESFRPGDVIVAINNQRVRNLDGLRTAINAFRPGDAVVAQIQRGPRMQYISFEME